MGGNPMTAGRRVNTLSQNWGTPHKYVNAVKRFWGGKIDLDPCSNQYSIVKAKIEYSLPDADGLQKDWNEPTIYVNPPYGADRNRGTTIKDWLAKCAQAYIQNKSEVIALIPVAPNTRHWKNYVFGKATSVCFLYDTRLRFLEDGMNTGKGAPMACCLVYWGDRVRDFFNNFIEFGAVVDISNLTNVEIGKDKGCPELSFYETEKTVSNEI